MKVTDRDGDTNTDTLNVTIVDDVPTAVADTNSVKEDTAPNPVSGNVFDANGASSGDKTDTIGADKNSAPVTAIHSDNQNTDGTVGNALAGQYGSLTLNSDGTYSYTLDNSNVDVQHLTDGEQLTETYTYTITDGDGDTSSTTLTITINGTDDQPHIDAIDGNDTYPHPNGDITVYESALSTGSNPGSTQEQANGTIVVDAKDGLDKVTIGGTDITQAQLFASASTPITVNTTYGTITINGFTPVDSTHADGSGTINYTYTLTGNTTNHSAAGNDEVTDAIAVKVTDRDGDTNTDTLNVTIVDDVPTAKDDANQNIEEGSTTALTGNVITTGSGTDTQGADGATIHSFTYTDTNDNLVTYTFANSTDPAQTVTTKVGSLTVNPNGDWSFTPNTSVNEPTDAAKGTFSYTLIDGDGDISNSATQPITITDTDPDPQPATATINEKDIKDIGSAGNTTADVEVTKVLGIMQGKDDITDVKFNATTTSTLTGAALTSSGNALQYNISPDGHTLTATDGTNTVFTAVINNPTDATGSTQSVTLTLYKELDHNPVQGTNTLSVPLDYEVTDTDSSVTTTSADRLTVNVIDDVPTAVNDADQSIVEGSAGTLSGNLITDATTPDIKGADGAKIDSIRLDGTTTDIDISDGNDHTITTPTGTLIVNADGTWSFTPVASFDHDNHLSGDAPDSATNGSFSYVLKDSDGDTSNGHQTIDVTDGAAPTIDNSKNVLVKVYEGGVHSTFDGTSNYDRADDINDDADPSNDQMTSTPTLTHKLDFSLGSDSAGITEVTWEGHTQTLNKDTATSSDFILIDTTSDAIDKGILKVYYDGRWEYTSPDAYVHPNPPTPPGFDVNNFQTTFTYKVHDIDNDTAAVTGSQTIQVDDTFATIGSTTDATLNEKDLPTGTDPHPGLTTQTGTITVDASKLGGSYDIKFDASQIDDTWTKSDGTNTPGLSSNGDPVTYSVSADGHTLTAATSTNTIFTVQITNPTGPNPGYTTTLYHDLDHENLLLENGNLEFDFNITLTDDDGDKSPSTFKVSIVDDANVPTTDTLVVNEEGATGSHDTSTIINTNANATPANTVITTQGTYGYAEILANGQLKYTPSFDGTNSQDTNYSGQDTVQYTYTDANGVAHVTNVTVTIDPVSDAPTLVSTSVSTEEDTAVALGLTAPVVVDDIDQNGIGTAGDNPERLGAITLTGVTSGAELIYGGNTYTSTGAPITIVLSDLDENGDGTIDHINGVTGTLTMTKAEFESMQINPVPQSGDNLNITMKVTSYEVDSNGNPIAGVPGATSSTSVTVDVQAVTDTPAIATTGPASGDEDSWIRIDNTFTITPTVDQDGSEQYELVFDGTNLPAGTRYFVGSNPTGNGQDASGGFSVTVPGGTGLPVVPEIYIKTPDNDSADIDGITVTVNVTDTDSDSTDVAPLIQTESASTTIDIDVTPVANDTTITTDPSSGNEDTLIDLNLHFTIDDVLSVPGNETVTSVTIADIPDGAKIYKADGTTLVYENNTGATASTTITIDASTPISDVEGFKILPPGHSSKDFTLKVSATTQDIDDGGGQATATSSVGPVDVNVEVKPIAEIATDTNHDGNTDVTLNPDHTYATHAVEDAWYDFNTADAGFVLSASNEDDKNNSSNPYASEDTWVEFHSVRDSSGTILTDAQIMYNNGSIDVIKTLNAPVQIPIEYLNTVKFKAPDNYSGTVKVDMTLGTLDHDEDNPNSTNGPVNSLTSTLQMDVDPAVDPIIVAIAQSNGLEDAGRNPNGTIDASSVVNGIVLNSRVSSLDADGSEHVNVFIDGIPEDAAIYFDINGDGTKEIITATSNFGQVTEVPQGQTGPIDVVQYDTANHTWKLLVQNYDQVGQSGGPDKPLIIPPHNSNADIVLKASGYAVDKVTFSDGSQGTDTSAQSQNYDIHVFVKGVADDVVNNEIYAQDIVTSVDASTQDLTVTLDPNKSGKYSAVAEEDSGTTHTTGNTDTFVEFDLKNIFKTPDKIDSYDNLKTNDPNQNQIDTTVTDPNAATDDIASETLTVTIENLGADFDVTGATLVGGTGSSRIWATNAADIDAGKVKIITLKEHFSGEINFDLKYNTTEDDGDTKTSAVQPVSLLVTPEAEGITNVLQASTDVNEDALTHMTFATTTTLPDSDEYVSALGIAKDAYSVNGQNFNGISGADFTIYVGNGSGKKTIQDVAADPNDHRVELVTENGVDFYKITDNNVWENDLYVLYDADIGGKEDPANVTTPHQTDFGFKFDVSDKTQAVQNGTTVDLIDTKSGFQESANYTFNLHPVTDDITADAKDGDITDVDGDGTTDIAVSGHDVTISAPTTIEASVIIKGVDTQNENGTGTNGENGLDIDGSEQIRSIRIEGLPDGIGIIGGKYVGDTIDPATGLPTGNNTWLVDLNQNPIVMDTATKTYNLQFEVSGNYINAASATSDVKISFINQEFDSTLSTATPQSTAQTGDFTLTFHRDPNFGGSTTDAPMDIIGITDVNGDGVVDEKDGYTVDPTFDTNPADPYQGGFKEDTTTKLGDIIQFDINDVQGSLNAEENQNINSDLFSITVEGLDPNIVDVSAGGQPIHSGVVTGWRYENVNGTDILTYRGSGDKAAIEAALNALEITPKQDLNHNNINFIGQDDITFTTTLTTYTQSGVKDVVSTDFSGNIEPVTDTVSITPEQVDVQEDIVKTITFGLDTVDNSFDPDGDGTKNIFAHLVKSDTDSSPATTISVTYTHSTDVGNGQFGVTLGGVHFNPGETHDVPITVSGTTVDLDFIADSNESGKAYFEYTLYSQEDHAQNTNQHTGSLEIDIAPVADGLDTGGGNPTAHGKEDELIQVTDANGNPFSGNLIDNATNNTTPETLKTVILGDVPPGWLVYYGPSQTLAQNLGSNGGTNNYWNIPLGSGANPVPEIYVKAPAQIGGISTQFQLISGVEDGGQQVYASVPIDVSVLSVADPITMNPSPTGGVEGEKIPLNFNTASADVDGSEHYEVKLTGLGENAVLYFQGTELTSGVTYDRSTDTYTISESVGIEHNSIDKLTVTQNDFSGTVNAEIIVHDAAPNDGTTQSASGSFAMNISQQQATSGDNTLLYDKKGVDGLGGDDTVIFGTDWDGYYDGSDAAHTIDMSALKNIEGFDLTVHGDHHLTMTGAEVTAMTGNSPKALNITTDAGDSITLKDEGDNIWLQNGNDFTNINDGTKVTVNDPSAVTIDRTAPTPGDDIIGFDGTDIDAGAGNDRIVALDGTGIDFSKLHNIETLDLSKSGDHDLGTLSLSDVVNMTDTNDTLTIEGDNGNDKVTFNASDGWQQGASSGGYTEYTNSNDPTVHVKVDDDLTQTLVP